MPEAQFLDSQEFYNNFGTASHSFEASILPGLDDATHFNVTNLIGFLGTVNNGTLYLIWCSLNNNFIASYYRQSNAWFSSHQLGSFLITSPPINQKVRFQFFQVSGQNILPINVPQFSTISLSIEFYKQ